MADIDIEKLAIEARLVVDVSTDPNSPPSWWGCGHDPQFRRFAALVLEEAEKVCAHRMGHYTGGTIEWQAARMCRDDIRTIAEGLKK